MKPTKQILTILLLFCILTFLAAIPITLATTTGIQNINSNIDTTATSAGVKGQADITLMIAGVVNILLGLVGVIFIILIIYGGVQWMTAMGAEDKIAKAKKVISGAVVGLIIVMLGYAIAYFVATLLEAASH